MRRTALLLTEGKALLLLIDRITTIAGDRPDLRAEAAGMLAGRWFANPGYHTGYHLIAAGLTILAGVIDRRDVSRWLRAGYAYESVGAPALEALTASNAQALTGEVLRPNARLLSASALLLAHDESLQSLLDGIRSVAADRPDLRAEVAGTIAGSWFSAPEEHQGHELIAAGLTLVAGDIDPEAVAHWIRIGYQRGAD